MPLTERKVSIGVDVLTAAQITGLAELFAGREFSEAWEPREREIAT